MKVFIPSKKNRFIFWICKTFIKNIIKSLHNVSDIVIDDQSIKFLKSLKNERVLLFSNHPTTIEPHLTFYVSNLIGGSINLMASRAVFDDGGGFIGYIIRRAGAYSVIAGINDMASFQYSIQALSAPHSKLVIFPEGEPISRENSTLMPFQEGFAFLSMKGFDKARMEDPQADIFVLPLFCFYVYDASQEEMIENIKERMDWLEEQLNIKNDSANEDKLVKRLLVIGDFILKKYEESYGVTPKKEQSLKYRSGRLKHHILNKLAKVYQISKYNLEDNTITKLRNVYSTMELCQIGYESSDLPKLSKKENKKNQAVLKEVFHLIVMDEKHLISEPTFEKCFEWLERYEALMKKKKAYPPSLTRKAYIKIGNTFYLSEYHPKEKAEKRELVDKLTERVKVEIQSLLKESEPLAQKL